MEKKPCSHCEVIISLLTKLSRLEGELVVLDRLKVIESPGLLDLVGSGRLCGGGAGAGGGSLRVAQRQAGVQVTSQVTRLDKIRVSGISIRN